MRSKVQVTSRDLRYAAFHKDYQAYHIRQQREDGSWKIRQIHDPSPLLKGVQSFLANFILEQDYKLPYAHAFLTGCNTKTCVTSHIGQRIVLTLDIKDFFLSVPSDEIYLLSQWLAKSLNLSQDSWTIYEIVTLDDRLPQGAPTSPAISNLAFSFLDEQLSQLATYSRYADDLIFSGDIQPEFLIPKIQDIIQPYKINSKKIKVMSSNDRQEALGIVLNKKMNISRDLRNKLRGTLHTLGCKKEGLDIRTKGMLTYIRSVNPALAEQLQGVYKKAMTN